MKPFGWLIAGGGIKLKIESRRKIKMGRKQPSPKCFKTDIHFEKGTFAFDTFAEQVRRKK